MKDIRKFVNEQKATDMIITGSWNESISTKTMENFYIELEVFEVHQFINRDEEKRDATYAYGIKQIDGVVATLGIIQFVEGCELKDFNKVIEIDHRGFTIDANIEKYFKTQIDEFDIIDHSKIDSSRLWRR